MTRDDFCPVTAAARIVGRKWTLLIIYHLLKSPRRFCELQELLGGVNPTTLSQRLKMLEQEGLLRRHERLTVPPWVQYELTEKGKALGPVIEGMAEWGQAWLSDTTETPSSQGPAEAQSA
ncbi:MAG: helix-turn-helix transcriptional regulator [Chloroflexi bacterium]|nr:helix-turn-helix transcriptional regulator [Chloroflexota bacterium]